MKTSYRAWFFSLLWLIACDDEPGPRSVCTFNECDDRRPTLKFIENQLGVLGGDNINGNLYYSITELDSNGERGQSYLLCEYRRRPWPTAELTIFGRLYETSTHVVFSSRVMDNCDKPIFNAVNEEVFYTQISDIRARVCQNEFALDTERTEPLTRRWELVGIEERGDIRFPPCEAINPWIEFTTEPYRDDTTGTQQIFVGYSTVNEYGGAYSINSNSMIMFSGLNTTFVGSTTANMNYEEEFYQILQTSNRYVIDYNLLTLTDTVDTKTLLFQAIRE